MGKVEYVGLNDRLELFWMVREMGIPTYTAVNLTDNEDLVEHFPDIVELEESALYNE